MDWKFFLTVFGTVFVAELGDKTQLATLLYAADAKHSKLLVLAGSAAALVTSAAIAVAAGTLLARWVDERVLRWVAGLGFIAIGTWTLVRG